MNIQQYKSTGLHQFSTIENECAKAVEFFILLHGYSESAKVIYKRLGQKINKLKGENCKIIAINGLFPLVRPFEILKNNEKNREEKNILGFAWYFYDSSKDQFLIDYEVPAKTISHWINHINPNNLPVTIIGYSQGGYLAPFIACELNKNVKRVIGINCSFRYQMLPQIPNFRLDQFQGREDQIIDTKLAFERFDYLKKKGMKGEFHWVDGVDHKLTPTLVELILYELSNDQ